jgi:hypothetical protein
MDADASQQMLAAHQRMWHDFCRLMKYALVGVVIVVGIVLYLNAR